MRRAAIASAVCSLVTRNVDTPGGDIFVIAATVESAMVRVLA